MCITFLSALRLGQVGAAVRMHLPWPPMPATRGQGRRPVWLFVSAAWLAPAILAVPKEYVRGVVGGGPAADPRMAAFEGGDSLLYSFPHPARVSARAQISPREGSARRPAATPCRGRDRAVRRLGARGHAMEPSPVRNQSLRGRHPQLVSDLAAVRGRGLFRARGHRARDLYFAQARERETQAPRLEAQLAEARMAALRTQLQPHFLLNSLNAATVAIVSVA